MAVGHHEKRGAKIDRYQSRYNTRWSASSVAIMLRRLPRRVQTPADRMVLNGVDIPDAQTFYQLLSASKSAIKLY